MRSKSALGNLVAVSLTPSTMRAALAAVTAPLAFTLGLGCAYGAPYDQSDVETSCTDNVDNDSDGMLDCADPNCARVEACFGCRNDVDDDQNGQTDCADPSCIGTEACTSCINGLDDDGNGLVDCADPTCQGLFGCP
jgi:hypothetical protein